MLGLVNSPSWLKYIGDRGVRTLEDARNYLENGSIKSYRERGFGFYLVELKETGEPIGTSGLIRRDFLEDADIGFAFLPQHEGKGYAYESSFPLLKYANEQLGLKRLMAITNRDNSRSITLLRKLGLGYEGTMKCPGEEEPLELYGITLG